MFKTTTPEPTKLDRLIDELTERMLEIENKTSDEYKQLLEHLTKLEAIKKDNRPDRVSADAKAAIAANLAGILLILNYERANIFTSKAAAFLTKLR